MLYCKSTSIDFKGHKKLELYYCQNKRNKLWIRYSQGLFPYNTAFPIKW